MSNIESLPLYTENPSDEPITIDEEVLPPSYYDPPVGDTPVFFQNASPKGWSIIFNTRYYRNGDIFVGKDSIFKYTYFQRHGRNSEIDNLHRLGIGVPLFKVIVALCSPITARSVTFRIHSHNIQSGTSIDDNNNYYTFCQVKKSCYNGYNAFTFHFTPDPYQKSLNSKVVMFQDTNIPIYDYIYKGERHRWVDETVTPFFQQTEQIKFGFKHTSLLPSQISLCDYWSGYGDKLNNKHTIFSLFSSKFKTNTDGMFGIQRGDYYGTKPNAIFGLAKTSFNLGKLRLAELRIHDQTGLHDEYIEETDSFETYNSNFSLNQDSLVMICIATFLRMEKDIRYDISRKKVVKSWPEHTLKNKSNVK
ncbi:uncharacterized protein KGF55_000981 [Candida pseudojiufengensis]|uniref:uncharacterized protein n=1 Tax=Candida pseudojiufengensis TaxID=497109 RepID=UPI0022254B93|nr:uncharacterized protein KGF55_000981 [Candida pseudojiufengensis]KAI5965619.1 hypothetical protein KGF55_000981 [Candida pseudojiufengensis]